MKNLKIINLFGVGVNTAKELRKKDKKELEKLVQELKKKLSDLRFKFSSNKLKNVKEIGHGKKEVARILTILRNYE